MTQSLTPPSPQWIAHLKFRPLAFKLFHSLLVLNILAAILLYLIYHDHSAYVFFTFIPVFTQILIFLWAIPKLYSKCQFDTAKLRISFLGRSREWFFHEIEKVEFSFFSPRFFGGYSLFFKSGQSLSFPPLVSNAETLVQRISSTRPGLITPSDLSRYILRARLVDHSWARMREKLKRWHWVLLKYLGFPLALTWAKYSSSWDWPPGYEKSQQFLVLFSLVFSVHTLVALLLNHFEESLNLNHCLRRNLQERDLKFEQNLAVAAHLLTLILSFTLFTSLFS